MTYEEVVNYIQSKCKNNIFKELDEFLTDLDDCFSDKIELEGNIFEIEKSFINTDFENGIVECEYKVKQIK